MVVGLACRLYVPREISPLRHWSSLNLNPAFLVIVSRNLPSAAILKLNPALLNLNPALLDLNPALTCVSLINKT